MKNPVTASFDFILTEDIENPAAIGNLPSRFEVAMNHVMPDDDNIARIEYNLDLSALKFTKVGDYKIHLEQVGVSDDYNYMVDRNGGYTILISVRNKVDSNGKSTGELVATLLDSVIEPFGAKREKAAFASDAMRTSFDLQKVVSGNNADADEYFKFEIEFRDVDFGEVYTISGQDEIVSYHGETIATQSSFVVGEENYIYLKSGQKATIGIDEMGIRELPNNIRYKITELDAEDYETYVDGATENSKSSIEKRTENEGNVYNPTEISNWSTVFENVKNTSVMTGVGSATLSFASLTLVGVASFVVYMVISKRKA